MDLLKVQELRHYIADTNKGALTLMLRHGETKYQFVLDAVPVERDIHDELMDALFPTKDVVPQVQKEPVKLNITIDGKETLDVVVGDTDKDGVTTVTVPKRRGRPAGSKNK